MGVCVKRQTERIQEALFFERKTQPLKEALFIQRQKKLLQEANVLEEKISVSASIGLERREVRQSRIKRSTSHSESTSSGKQAQMLARNKKPSQEDGKRGMQLLEWGI